MTDFRHVSEVLRDLKKELNDSRFEMIAVNASDFNFLAPEKDKNS